MNKKVFFNMSAVILVISVCLPFSWGFMTEKAEDESAVFSYVNIKVEEDEQTDEISEIKINVEDFEYQGVKKENSQSENSESGESGINILLYHTHTNEAYAPDYEGQYEGEESQRTHDENYNIVSVGNVLAEKLEEYGFNVIHEKKDHEAEVFTMSYSNSLETMESYADKNIDVYIDMHRDSIDDFDYAKNDVVTVDGKKCARIMFVVGTGEGTEKYHWDKLPDWESNYALANSITQELNNLVPGIAKDVMVKKGRYNQHVSGSCLLVEMGYSANSLDEVKNSAEYLAVALKNVLS